VKAPKPPTPSLAQLVQSVLFRTKVVDASVGMFIALIGIAMMAYQGGTWWDATRQGHAFWENNLCDLLRVRTLGGHPNIVGARLATGGMLILVIGLVAAFSLAAEVIPSRRRLGRSIAWCGSLGSLVLTSSALLPSDKCPACHSVAVVFGSLPALIALAVFVGAILLEPITTRAFRALCLALLISVVLALSLNAWNAFLHGPSLRVLPGIARLANIMLLGWLLWIAQLTRRRLFDTYLALEKRRATP